MEKAIEEGEVEEVIEGDCTEERSRINVSIFGIEERRCGGSQISA